MKFERKRLCLVRLFLILIERTIWVKKVLLNIKSIDKEINKMNSILRI